MSFPSFQRAPPQRLEPGRLGWTAVGAGGAAVAGAAAAAGLGFYVLVLVVFVAATAAAVLSWRRSLVWLLLYLPVSGLLPLLMYPHTGPGVLLKDALFVGPAYVGALVAAVRRRERFDVPGIPLILLACLSLLIVVEAFNPHLPRPFVGAIGVRVWLFYVPLIVLGYHFADRREQVQKLLKWMLVVAMIPCVLGIIEAVLVYNGHAAAVYRLYGAAAAAATQDYTAFDFGLTRIPSIFTFIAQYWLFSTATVALGYAAWRGNRNDRTMSWFGPLAIGVAALASLTSGARAAFIFTPLLLVMIVLLERISLARLVKYVAASALAVLVSLEVLNIGAGPLAHSTSSHTGFILSFFGQGLHFAEHHALWGLGTGIDTNQARYAFGNSLDYAVVYRSLGGVWYESWYLKAFIELGVLGVFLVICTVLALMRRCLLAHRETRDPELRSMSAAFIALFAWTAIYTVKTAYIDYDPLDVYVWLFIGMQWRLRTMAAPGPAP
jgi:hypothetical protein